MNLYFLLPSLAALALSTTPAFAQDGGNGPDIQFSRQGANVCASYSLTGRHNLYRDKIFAYSGGKKLALSGMPQGMVKSVGGSPQTVMAKSFKACAAAPSATAPITWIDQSCLAVEGVCLPPRALEVGASGQSKPLNTSAASSAFMAATTNGAPPSNKGWGQFSFKPR